MSWTNLKEWLEYIFFSKPIDIPPRDEIIRGFLIWAIVVAIYWLGIGIGGLLDLIIKKLKQKGWK